MKGLEIIMNIDMFYLPNHNLIYQIQRKISKLDFYKLKMNLNSNHNC